MCCMCVFSLDEDKSLSKVDSYGNWWLCLALELVIRMKPNVRVSFRFEWSFFKMQKLASALKVPP